MMDNLISVGNKIELKQIQDKMESSNEDVRTYISQVLDITDDTIQAAMPIYEGHLIPLEVGSKHDVFFKTNKGLYRAICEVKGRSKVEKIYMVELKPISDFKRFQRRQFFRFNTTIDASVCILSEPELKNIMLSSVISNDYDNRKKNAVIIDISGGGVKIVSNELYNKNDLIIIEFNLTNGASDKLISVPGRVITSIASNSRVDLHEHRIEYYKIPKEVRELIIKYIFDEQRRIRQKERG